MTASGSRKTSWITLFLEATDHLPSPEIFRRWTAIAGIAAALERRVWMRAFGDVQLFPNMYTILVGPPGVGKSIVLKKLEPLWRGMTEFHVAPSSVTAASLIDAMADAKRQIVRMTSSPPEVVNFNSLQVLASELGVFMPTWDSEFMMGMMKFYDCEFYDQRRRTASLKIKIENPQLNLIAGTTPSFVTKFFADGTWDQGFMSRAIVIYSGDRMPVDPFADPVEVKTSAAQLATDLQQIYDLYGEVLWTPEAKAAFRAWMQSGEQPAPDHPRLLHYLSRRRTHLLKLCIVASVSRGNDLAITLEDYNAALSWLVAAEETMPDLFKSMATGGDDSQHMDEAFQFVFKQYMKERQQPIAEHRLMNFLRQRVPAHSVYRIIQVMMASRMIEQVPKDGKSFYRPLGQDNLL